MIAAFVLAAVASPLLAFHGFVPPHAAADGVRYRIEARAPADVPGAMKACGIEDFKPVPATEGAVAYQFAVTRSTDALAHCLHGRLARAGRMEQIDNWIPDAQAD